MPSIQAVILFNSWTRSAVLTLNARPKRGFILLTTARAMVPGVAFYPWDLGN